jgi:hypothetical protein
MSFNDATLLRTVTQDIIFGLRGQVGAFADMACKRYSRAALSGTEPVFATAQTLAQTVGKKAIGHTLEDRNAELSSVNWNMGEFAEKFRVPKATLTDLDQYMDSLGEISALLARDVDSGVDTALAALLVSATYNNSQAAAAGNWSVNTSTPIVDLQNAYDKTPGADTLILGLTSARELARHPDLKERTSNYAGAGSIGFDQLRGALAEALNISGDRVLIFGSYYNSANPGQTATLAYHAGDLAWVGHSDGLRMYEQDYSGDLGADRASNEGLVSTVDDHNNFEIGYRRVLDVVRGDKDLGVYLTGL